MNSITYSLKLNESPFSRIKSGQKTIELRLFDDKRKQIRLGDFIEFRLQPELEETIKTQVTGLLNYPMFSDLVNDLPLEYFGCETKQQALEEVSKFYPEEDQVLNSVLGIRIKIVENVQD